jgi:hypothetical protein
VVWACLRRRPSTILDADGHESPLVDIRQVDVKSEDVTGAGGARKTSIIGGRLDRLSI